MAKRINLPCRKIPNNVCRCHNLSEGEGESHSSCVGCIVTSLRWAQDGSQEGHPRWRNLTHHLAGCSRPTRAVMSQADDMHPPHKVMKTALYLGNTLTHSYHEKNRKNSHCGCPAKCLTRSPQNRQQRQKPGKSDKSPHPKETWQPDVIWCPRWGSWHRKGTIGKSEGNLNKP